MIVDFHTHCFPDHLAQAAVTTLSDRCGIPCYTDGTEDSLRASMERAGITHSVLCSIAVKPGQSAKTNAFAARFLRQGQRGGTRIVPFASVHPLEEDWREILKGVSEAGFRGIKLHPDYQRFYVDDPSLKPFYREIARLGLVVLFHAGRDLGLPEPVHATPARFANSMDLLEQCTTVIAHMGSYRYEREALDSICGRNVYLDTSYSLGRMDKDTAKRIFSRHTPDRLLFGSDSPWTEQSSAVEYLRDSFAPGFLSGRELDKVLWKNAAGLLGL